MSRGDFSSCYGRSLGLCCTLNVASLMIPWEFLARGRFRLAFNMTFSLEGQRSSLISDQCRAKSHGTIFYFIFLIADYFAEP